MEAAASGKDMVGAGNHSRTVAHLDHGLRPGSRADANPARFTAEPGAFALYVGSTLHATSELTLEVV